MLSYDALIDLLKANDKSGLIGAAVVGGFVAIVAIYYLGRKAIRGGWFSRRSIRRKPTPPGEGQNSEQTETFG